MAALALTGAAAAILILRARWQEQYWRVLKTYAAPIMNTAELEAISVPLGNFEQSLLPTMTKHGCALVTGVIDESTLRSLETSFHFDLVSLVDEDAVNNGEPSMKQLYEKLKTGGVADFPKENIMSLTGTGLALKRCLLYRIARCCVVCACILTSIVLSKRSSPMWTDRWSPASTCRSCHMICRRARLHLQHR